VARDQAVHHRRQPPARPSDLSTRYARYGQAHTGDRNTPRGRATRLSSRSVGGGSGVNPDDFLRIQTSMERIPISLESLIPTLQLAIGPVILIAGVIIALFVGCMLSLIGSLISFIWDVNLSLRALWLDFPVERRGEVKLILPGRPGLVPRVRRSVFGQ